MVSIVTWLESNWSSLLIAGTVITLFLKTYNSLKSREKAVEENTSTSKIVLQALEGIKEDIEQLKDNDKEQRKHEEAVVKKIEEINTSLGEVKDNTFHLSCSQKVIMQDRLKYLSDKYIRDKKISLENKVNYDAMYKSYKKDLHANGDLALRYDMVMSLPVDEEVL